MKLIKGADLSPSQVDAVKRAFVYRLTVENGYPKRNPCGASVPAISDAQWLTEHAFYIKKDGTLSAKQKYAEPAYLAESRNAC